MIPLKGGNDLSEVAAGLHVIIRIGEETSWPEAIDETVAEFIPVGTTLSRGKTDLGGAGSPGIGASIRNRALRLEGATAAEADRSDEHDLQRRTATVEGESRELVVEFFRDEVLEGLRKPPLYSVESSLKGVDAGDGLL